MKNRLKFIDFFPSYPSIENSNFFQELYEKKEFQDLGERGITSNFLNHQLISARFLAPYTFYQGLLLIHDTGTGKSGCAAATLNTMKEFDENFTMVYLTSNDTLIRNFKQELLKLCPWVIKRKKKWDNENTFFRKNNIFFSTFGSFEQSFSKISKLKFKRVFFIFDEIHHLITKEMTNYNNVIKFIESVPEKKILALTATPMRDDSIELIYLLNIVLKNRLPTGKDFIKEFLEIRKIDNLDGISQYIWKPNKDIDFREKIKGYVSVYRQRIDNIKVEYMGKNIPELEFTKIYMDKMNKFQEDIYRGTWGGTITEELESSEEIQDSLYNRSIQSSLMVFPDKTFGAEGGQKYTKKAGPFNSKFFEETGLHLPCKNEKEEKENLEIIGNYSCIYENIIKNILHCKKMGKSVYVYSEKINGSGILRCVHLLEQCFGYKILSSGGANPSNILREKKERLIFLGNEDIMKLLEVFNSSENKHGEYVRVIFGTDKTTEGITLKNIQQIHITTPGWNFGKKNQAEGRGIRYGSHFDLGKKEINVNIFLHCVIPKELRNSVNLLQYKRSEIKEKNIFLFLYAMLRSSIDCQLNYYQNFRNNAKDYSSECFFEKCEYTCDGEYKSGRNVVPIRENLKGEIDSGNYNTFYLGTNSKVIEEIRALFFQNEYPKTFHEIKIMLEHHKFSDFQIYYNLMKIIETPILIPLRDGSHKYLIYQNGYLYLTTDRNILLWNNEIPLYENEYQLPSFKIHKNIHKVRNLLCRDDKILDKKINLFLTLLRENKKKEIYDYFHSLPQNIRSILIEKFPTLKILEEGKYDERSNSIITKDGIIVTENKRIEQLEKNPFGLYGITTKNSFKIRDVSEKGKILDKRTKTKGQDVKTIEVSKLVSYILRFRKKLTDSILKLGKTTKVEGNFEDIKEKYVIFKDHTYNNDEKELIIYLISMFSNKRRFLIELIKEDIINHNLMIDE